MRSVYIVANILENTDMPKEDAAHIFRTYNKSLYNTALRLTASPIDSEEIVQETLCRYLMRVPRMKNEAQRAKWLRTTCVRLSIDFLRREKKFVSLEKVQTLDDESGESWDKLGADTMGLVMEEIRKLPDGQRAVLVLKALEDYEYSEIAKLLGISESTARSQYLRARRRVCENVQKRSPQ